MKLKSKSFLFLGMGLGALILILHTLACAVMRQHYSLNYAFLSFFVEAVVIALILLLMRRLVISRLVRLNESEERYRGIVEEQTELISRFLPSGELTYVNDGLCRFYGKSREELIGRGLESFLVKEDWDSLVRVLASLSPENPAVTLDERVKMPDGRIRWLQWNNRAIFGKEGRAVEYQGVGRDITAQKRGVEELKARAERTTVQQNAILELSREEQADFQTALKRITEVDAKTLGVEIVSIWLFNDERTELLCLDQYRKNEDSHRRSLSLSVEKYPVYFSNLEQNRLIVADDVQNNPGTRELAEDYLIPFGITSMIDAPVRLHGRAVGVVCHEHIGPRREWTEDEQNFAGSMADMVSLAIESSKRARAEEARRLLSTAIEQTAECIIISDPDGRVQYVNPVFEKVTGYRLDEILGRNLALLKSGAHDDSFFEGMWRTLKSGGNWEGRITNRKKDGSLFEEEVAMSPIRDASGKIVNFVEVRRDITQEVALEKRLRHAQKMEAVGTLAGGLAHDFNNILAGIMGYAALMKREAGNGSAMWKDLESIEMLSRRGADLTNSLLTFARGGDFSPAPLQVNRIVEQVLKVMGKTVAKDIDIRSELSPGGSNVMGDKGQLYQVLMNLCINAAEAMPGGGALTVKTEEVIADTNFIALHPTLKEGRYVSVTVADTGAGMDECTRNRIFEPFFTTKSERSGTGLGLSIVGGIVDKHGGGVDVESGPGKGSVFTIYLPVTDEEERRVTVEKEGAPGGDETILVVDDNAPFRHSVARWFSGLGYTVLEAESGIRALEIVESDGDEIDLLLLDMVMKQMSGAETFRRARGLKPDLRVIILTGYARGYSSMKLLEEGARDFIQKPFDMMDLAVKIRHILDDR